jgi:hypothetical protein
MAEIIQTTSASSMNPLPDILGANEKILRRNSSNLDWELVTNSSDIVVNNSGVSGTYLTDALNELDSSVSTLSEVLNQGNSSDGYDIDITGSSSITNSDASGISIYGGNATAGGSVQIQSGSSGSTNSGGNISITSGAGGSSGVGGSGGAISIISGNGNGTGGYSGSVSIASGTGSGGSGDVVIYTSNSTSGESGLITIRAGTASSSASAGGDIIINSGSSNGSSDGGTISITSGAGGSSAGGGGGIFINAGIGGSTNGAGGDINITAGRGYGAAAGGNLVLKFGRQDASTFNTSLQLTADNSDTKYEIVRVSSDGDPSDTLFWKEDASTIPLNDTPSDVSALDTSHIYRGTIGWAQFIMFSDPVNTLFHSEDLSYQIGF